MRGRVLDYDATGINPLREDFDNAAAELDAYNAAHPKPEES